MAYSIKTFRRLFERTWDLIILSRTNKHYFLLRNRNADNESLKENFREKQQRVGLAAEKDAEVNSLELLKHSRGPKYSLVSPRIILLPSGRLLEFF